MCSAETLVDIAFGETSEYFDYSEAGPAFLSARMIEPFNFLLDCPWNIYQKVRILLQKNVFHKNRPYILVIFDLNRKI